MNVPALVLYFPAGTGFRTRMANAIRFLAIGRRVAKPNPDIPDMPNGHGHFATVRFSRFLRFDPVDPAWPDRGSLLLSAGHCSHAALTPAYLTGYEGLL